MNFKWGEKNWKKAAVLFARPAFFDHAQHIFYSIFFRHLSAVYFDVG